MELRWAIVGCGDVCERKSGPALAGAEGSSVVAVMRRDAAKAADFAQRHGVPRWYDSVDGVLRDPAVNAVYVATPPHLHREHVLAALAAGHKVVLVEKPMGMDAGECDAMVAAAAAAGARLYVAFYRRAYPKWRAAREALQGGAIGRVLGARLQMCAQGSAAGWRVDPAVSGGGHFVDVGSHRLDTLLYLLGCPPVEAVHGFAANGVGHHAAENDVAFALRTATGVLVTGSFHYHTAPPRDVLEIYGSAGTLVCDPFDGTDARVLPSGGGEPRTLSFPTPSPVHLPFVQALVADVRAGGAGVEAGGGVVVDGEQGAVATRVMDAVLAEWRATHAAPAAAV